MSERPYLIIHLNRQNVFNLVEWCFPSFFLLLHFHSTVFVVLTFCIVFSSFKTIISFVIVNCCC
jgi:hypothetical protein